VFAELMDFLGKWLVEHIQGSDRKYAAFIAAKPAVAPRPSAG